MIPVAGKNTQILQNAFWNLRRGRPAEKSAQKINIDQRWQTRFKVAQPAVLSNFIAKDW